MFMQFRQTLRRWYREEREKISQLNHQQAVRYIWTYYKLWIIGLVTALIVIVYMTHLYMTSARGNWLYVCFANVPPRAQMGDGGALHRAFADYAGYDLREKNLVFDDNCYCQPSVAPYGNTYYDKLVALIDSGVLDLLIMEEPDLITLGRVGRLMDLQGEVYQIAPQWDDRLIYCQNDDETYEKELVPIAIDLSGSILTTENGAYPGGCAVAISAYAGHLDQVQTFLSFLFPDSPDYISHTDNISHADNASDSTGDTENPDYTENTENAAYTDNPDRPEIQPESQSANEEEML